MATWKVIATDTPLGTITASSPGARTPLGRGIEIADLLSFMERAGIRNTVWITADLHYTAAHYFDPNNAIFQGFEPFWEFVSGPIHAGTWTPSHSTERSVLASFFKPHRVVSKAITLRRVSVCSSLVMLRLTERPEC